MQNPELIQFYRNHIAKNLPAIPAYHIVLGSGFGEALAAFEKNNPAFKKLNEIQFAKMPGLFATTVVGHSGMFQYFEHLESKKVIAFQCGRLHGYEGHLASTAVLPVTTAALCGTKNFILTNAAGALHTKFSVGSVVLLEDHFNFTGQNPLLGPNPVSFETGKPLGPRFPDISKTFDPEFTKILKNSLASKKLEVHSGKYIGVLGPSFETPAEVKTFASWGYDVVGMSTVWEVIALKYLNARIAGISLVSNYGSGLTDKPLDHETLLEASHQSAAKVIEGIVSNAALSL